jgi:hypothetical protein
MEPYFWFNDYIIQIMNEWVMRSFVAAIFFVRFGGREYRDNVLALYMF